MTLSRWLRDYLYIPLGGNRGRPLLTYRNLMLTMLLGGLWHGAAWTFVVWGGLHGAGARRRSAGGVERPRLRGAGADDRGARWRARLVTFHFVCLAWIFFRSDSFGAAWEMIDGPLHRLGRGVPARHRRRPARDRRRHRLAVPAGARPAARDGALLAPPGRSGRRGAWRSRSCSRASRAGGRGTLHLLPVLMTDELPSRRFHPRSTRLAPSSGPRPVPTPPPRGAATTAVAPRARRSDGGPPRRLWSAGHALVVCVLALAIGLLLNAPGIHKSAYNQPDGWQRDVALAVTGPLADVSHALLLDRPRTAVQAASVGAGRRDRHRDRLPRRGADSERRRSRVPRRRPLRARRRARRSRSPRARSSVSGSRATRS